MAGPEGVVVLESPMPPPLRDAVAALGASDALIFHVLDGRLSLIGGFGRGEGWSGIVDVALSRERNAARVMASCHPLRVEDSGGPVHIIGPY
ncbi:MAG: hypothetical protein ABR498_08015, partial [Candidatus Dormibacteria bacterium]